jgi:3-phosphoglycerate kinase
LKSIKKIKDWKGVRVLVRVDFNVPIKDGVVEDDFRIKKALPTIKFLSEAHAKVILISHLGKGETSLKVVAEILNKNIPVKFVEKIVGTEVENTVKQMEDGDVVLLENLRMHKGEQGGDKLFAMSLAKLGEVYVNDAFSVSHREDASIVLVPKILPSCAGFQLEEEVKHLSKPFSKPKHPFLFILGGAKFSTKMPLIEKYLELADQVFIGGALLNDFLETKGLQVGDSLVDDSIAVSKNILENPKLILPTDVVVKSNTGELVNKKVNEVLEHDTILDVGEESVENLAPYIKDAKLILWNGPLGKYEELGGGATKKVLELVAKSKAETIIGGGDTVEIISEAKMEDEFSFVSTGGGATLDFLANGTLPGIEALK